MSGTWLVAFILMSLWASWGWWKALKHKQQARAAEANHVQAFWGGYFTALVKEGYSKGEAVKRTREMQRSVSRADA